MNVELLRAAVLSELRLHPRVAQQGLGGAEADRSTLAATLPALPPFGARDVHSVIAVLDWDHRLPSRQLVLRVHVFYATASVLLFEQAFTERGREIVKRDLFPEFDLPDYEDLPADESYEAVLSPELAFEAMKLVSLWRREVDAKLAAAAVEAVRVSAAFAAVRVAEPTRPPHLGELEPVAWMPPCETGHARWTLDIWWLTAFDGRVGRGWSFLVDIGASEPVTAHREFSVRAN